MVQPCCPLPCGGFGGGEIHVAYMSQGCQSPCAFPKVQMSDNCTNDEVLCGSMALFICPHVSEKKRRRL